MPLIITAAAGLGILAMAATGTALIRLLAPRFGWVARPRRDRWHQRPTALMGGLGFVPPFLLAGAAILVFFPGLAAFAGHGPPEGFSQAAGLLAGALLVFLVGLADDLWELRPASKLLGQLVAASVFIAAGGHFAVTGIPVADTVWTYLWIIAITNAVNMLDNMDGLSSGVVMVAAATLALLGGVASAGNDAVFLGMPLAVALSAVALGFLFHNRPPASIFMGDSGSLVLGFALACLAIPGPLNGSFGFPVDSVGATWQVRLGVPVVALAVPLFDALLVTVTRMYAKLNPAQGGTDHASHRLVRLGLDERRTVLALIALGGIAGSAALLMQRSPDAVPPVVGFLGSGFLLVGVYLGGVPVRPTASPGRGDWRDLLDLPLLRSHGPKLLLDMVLVALSFYSAYLLRFEGKLSGATFQAMALSLPLVVASCLTTFAILGLYRCQWRHFSQTDLIRHGLAVWGGVVVSLATVTLVTRFSMGHSRSAFVIFGVLLLVAMVGSRLSFSLLEVLVRQGNASGQGRRTPVLIYGAGRSGRLAQEEVLHNPSLAGYEVVGFVDDDPHTAATSVGSVAVGPPELWTGRTWERTPEIWVSSRFIPDDRALLLSRSLGGVAPVRRLRLTLSAMETTAAGSIERDTTVDPGWTGAEP